MRVMRPADIIQEADPMNIFQCRRGILGSNDLLIRHNVLTEFLETARDIRRA